MFFTLPSTMAETDGEYYPVDEFGVTHPYKIINGISYSLNWTQIDENGIPNYYLIATISEPSNVPEELSIPDYVYFQGQQDENYPSYWEWQGEYPVSMVDLQDSPAYPTDLKSVYLPATVTDIVLACHKLENIEVDPSNPKYSSDYGLLLDKSKNTLIIIPYNKGSVIVPESVTTIGLANTEDISSYPLATCADQWFWHDVPPALNYIALPGNVETISKSAFSYCSNLENINLPGSLRRIMSSAFSYCTNLNNIELPNSLLYIGTSCFSDCPLQSISIPKNVCEISERAFYGCKQLKEINVDENNTTYESYSGILFSKNLTTLLCIPEGFNGTFSIPESTKIIGNYACYDVSGIKEVVFHDGITEIGKQAFYSNMGKRIRIDNFILPLSLEVLGDNALAIFFGEIIKLPACLRNIGNHLFNTGYNTLISASQTPAEAEAWSFTQTNSDKTKKLIVPTGCVQKYKEAKGWNRIANISTFAIGNNKVKLNPEQVYQNWLITATDDKINGVWSTTDESIAYTNESNLFVATDNHGSCKISFSSEGNEESCEVTVSDSYASTVNKLAENSDNEHKIIIDGISDNGRMLNVHLEPVGIYEQINWNVSDDNIATINHGLIYFSKNSPVKFTVNIANGNSDTFDYHGESAIDNIIEEENESSCQYYNLQGIKIEKPTKGIYIVKSGNSVKKIILQ